MHVTRIAINNFRNFRALDLQGLSAASIIVGENASGKSNLIAALRLVLDPSLPDTDRELTAEDFWDGLTAPFGGAEILVTVELAGFDQDDGAKAILSDYLVARDPFVARVSYLWRPRALGDSSTSGATDYEWVLFGGNDEARKLNRELWRYVSLRVLPALRDAERDLESVRSPLRRLISRLNVPDEMLLSVATQVDEATSELLGNAEIAEASTALTGRLEGMVGDVFGVQTKLGLTATRPGQLLRSIRLFIDEEKQRTLGQASLGTANLLYLALLFELVGREEAAGERVATVFAVEEPEAHLHPQVQRVLFKHLLSDGHPLIVSTHSPHLASVTPLASLVLLRDIGGETQAFVASELGLSTREVRDLERYLDVTRAEILFAKGVVLVEGIAEAYLIPAFARVLGYDLDASGISVCAVHGTDFGPYVKLLSSAGLSIPRVVITDGDPTSSGRLRGVVRGRALLDDADAAEAVTAAIEDDDIDGARDILQDAGIYVGELTLELDLLPAAVSPMAAAYAELVSSSLRRERFEAALKGADGDPEDHEKVISRIERIGKGRFAQRLAAHVSEFDAPEYISDAIEAIVQEVHGDV